MLERVVCLLFGRCGGRVGCASIPVAKGQGAAPSLLHLVSLVYELNIENHLCARPALNRRRVRHYPCSGEQHYHVYLYGIHALSSAIRRVCQISGLQEISDSLHVSLRDCVPVHPLDEHV
jgi:hypothetical protein